MSPHNRRKSVDSSDSSSGSDSDHGGKDSHKKEKKDKKDKDKKDKKKDKQPHQEGQSKATNYGHPSTADIDNRQARLHTSQIMDYAQGPPPAYPPPLPRAPSSHPPSGYRVPLTTQSPFPPPAQAGPAVAHDLDGSPIFIGSAIMERSVHPCKIGPHLQPYVAVPYGGAEFGHHGRYDLLPFDGASMEWVPTSHGQIPPGRSPVEGGYEEGGEKLYHALGDVNGVKVPGKTGQHLNGANVSFGGAEIAVSQYEILCVLNLIQHLSLTNNGTPAVIIDAGVEGWAMLRCISQDSV